ncbi:GNAT family N-acetyltransferase [Sulfitobacter aestuariivivens]|uniref:GNAT family N-acetyltransferase n=1 Tax=Sulfitobacter aestuariivivens TaxID=2766981 RepID=A0A927D8R1_9RHOB|nr:GNAT family N-acetyltransferase [Sulfitobacter aestuariivivens]MBD3664831.1 GNAT family N-acetyltransferase [Sulfitobacter aestuariivivens]
MKPTASELFEICDATWPAARQWDDGPWTFREGKGGGKRVSAATSARSTAVDTIDVAEAGMTAMGQTPLFMIRAGDETLDKALAQRGYGIVDPVTLYTLPIAQLTDVPIPRVTAFTIWEPLAIMAEIWAKGGIGPARLDVMARAKTKTGILARWNEKPAGAAFAAVHNGVCMVHAVEVLSHQRRQGVAVWMMRRAAFWAQAHGADYISVLCVERNIAANALYQALGFTPAGQYHYRQCAQ